MEDAPLGLDVGDLEGDSLTDAQAAVIDECSASRRTLRTGEGFLTFVAETK
jgi:hypothetical protein